MRKSLFTTAISAAFLSSLAFGVQASTEPQGMYSADDILDAEVFFNGGSGEEIGEVEDILFDEEMRISALVIESGAVLGLGGREIVVNSDQFTLETHTESDGDTEHRIMLDASQEEVESFPTYDRDWWEQTKNNARDAWQTTKEGAQSAWQSTREAVNDNE
ncbi:PRC-barrel domain-containing protein [Halomonas qinghailakensis]|uniref:PRC-barrel domain-containing protein n=2 Tax=Halomonas TaxID=2745 RepID=A0AA46TRG3_9GAMM|nr:MULTISPECIES: PRC-barrel domain-containing protein [Halomonas]UYO75213.1 PRC-barrel domain-containing protein [Halomonas sp. ZZQ-149]UYV19891.1 PRC-barrel domain-containing protein [Halomonas qaidamensis]